MRMRSGQAVAPELLLRHLEALETLTLHQPDVAHTIMNSTIALADRLARRRRMLKVAPRRLALVRARTDIA